MNRADRQEAVDLLRRVLKAVDRGDLTADGPAAVALVRRLEGALLALRAIEQTRAEGALIGTPRSVGEPGWRLERRV